jgi:hypothetical protein
MKKAFLIAKILAVIIIIAVSTLLIFRFINLNPNTGSFNLSKADNWFLPEKVIVTENSGYYDYWTNSIKPQAESVELSWNEVENEEGKYNWSILKEKLNKAKAENRKIWLRIYMADLVHVPAWFSNKYPDLPKLDYKPYQENINGYSQGLFYPLWDEKLETRIDNLLQDLAKQNIISDPSFAFMYAPFAWRWNEWETTFISNLEGKYKFTPESFLVWYKKHLEIYKTAFTGYEYKVMYTGNAFMDWCDGNLEWIKKINNLKTGNNIPTDIAVNLGFSVRRGDLEYFNSYSNLPSWGYPAKQIGKYYYQYKDETHPLVADSKRLIGTENEAFGDDNMFPGTSDYYFPRMATLKSLQVGVNWMNIQEKTYNLAPELFEYTRLEMGKNTKTRHDAWVSLRQWNDLSLVRFSEVAKFQKDELPFNQDIPFRNWELDLYQREVKNGGETTATTLIGDNSNHPFYFYNGESYEALRTDLVSGNNYMYFKANPKFTENSLDDRIKYKIAITYLDKSDQNWQLEYYNKDKKIQNVSIQYTNSNQWKTVIVDLPNIIFKGNFDENMDFRFNSLGKADVTASFVRLIKI